jgi:hypothetical protein|tara:strand:+ start:1196 stop:1837 length:642 start_codon:yes stop_codon:yes gene_type:complete
MSMMQSMPWMLKAVLLGSNLYAQMQAAKNPETHSDSMLLESAVHRLIMTAVLCELILMFSTVLPSLLFSVRNRKETTNHIGFQILYHLHAYVLICFLFRERNILPLLHIAAQFLYVHFHYWQAHTLSHSNKVLLYGKTLSILHGVAMGILPLGFLMTMGHVVQVNAQSTGHTAFWGWILILFVGEIVSTSTSILNVLLKTSGEVYEATFGDYK